MPLVRSFMLSTKAGKQAWIEPIVDSTAKTVRFDYYNTQEQQKFVWPPSFALAKAYLDQLQRSNGLAAARITATRDALAAAERASGQQRQAALTQLATQLNGEASGSSDQAKVKLLAAAVISLANAR
jgi:hypothetical protein